MTTDRCLGCDDDCNLCLRKVQALELQIEELKKNPEKIKRLDGMVEQYAKERDDALRLINEMKPVFDAAVALGDLIHMVDDYDDPKDEWARLDKAIKGYAKRPKGDKSGGDAARCARCGKYYVEHEGDVCCTDKR